MALVLDNLPTISIHAPVKGATKRRRTGRSLSADFNPRSREGSDAPRDPAAAFDADFNPRSREGSDLDESGIYTRRSDFNPRSREGSDMRNLAKHGPGAVISIHAPVKGAT